MQSFISSENWWKRYLLHFIQSFQRFQSKRRETVGEWRKNYMAAILLRRNINSLAACWHPFWPSFHIFHDSSVISTSFASLMFAIRIGVEIYYIPKYTKTRGQRAGGSEINQHNKSAGINMNYGVCARVFALQNFNRRIYDCLWKYFGVCAACREYCVCDEFHQKDTRKLLCLRVFFFAICGSIAAACTRVQKHLASTHSTAR